MLILALDTSGDLCSVAVTREESLLVEYAFAHQRRLTERLPGIVAFVLGDVGVTLGQIDAFAVGIGPGSFTGVRVGVTMAKIWAEVYQKPLLGVSSFDALQTDVPAGAVACVAPSRKGEVIAQFAGEAGVCPVDAVIERARAAFGDGPLVIAGECAHWIPEADGVVHWRHGSRAGRVAEIAYRRFQDGQRDDPATLAPLYVAPPPIRAPKGETP